MIKTVLLLIKGHVQGVNYRMFLKREADKRGLEGWARNLSDPGKSVEVLVTGDDAKVDELIGAAGRGPVGARVDSVKASDTTTELLNMRNPGEKFSRL